MSNYEPVKVSIGVENPSLERGAFYNICFITENDTAPRTLQVNRLSDLLYNGYSRLDLAYNFCVGVFSQQGIDTVYIRAKRSSESYVEAYNSEDNSMYYFVVLQTKDLTEIEKFNSHLVNSDEMKLQFFSQNVGSKTLQSPKLVNYYQDYIRPEGGVSSDDRDFYLNSAYEGLITQIKLSLPDYLLSGLGDIAIDYGIYNMTGKKQIWEIDKAGRRIRYATQVLQQGWVGSKEESTVNGSDITVVAYRGSDGVSKKSTVLNPKVKNETISSQLLKGLGKEVLDYAILLIDPEATDWVLDPANNRIKYTDPKTKYTKYKDTKYYSADDACSALASTLGSTLRSEDGGDYWYCYKNSVTKAASFNVYTEKLDKYVPLTAIAAQVVSNAESGHAPSQEALRLSTVERVSTGEYDEALEAASIEIDTSWKYLPIYDVAVQVKRNSIAGHAESIEAVNNSLPFELPNYEPNITITGIAKVGEILTATVTDANGLPSIINYQWYAGGEVISGATAETYVLKEAEAGKGITVKAQFTDNDGHVESVISPVSELVVSDTPANVTPIRFKTSNLKGSNEYPLQIKISADGEGSWELIESGDKVADSSGFLASGVTSTTSTETWELGTTILTLSTVGAIKNYELFAKNRMCSLNHIKDSEGVDGTVNVENFSNDSPLLQLRLANTHLTVPNTLPSYMTDLTLLFYTSDLFNQNISGWDTRNVTNMSGLFQDCKLFNQDVSGWDTRNVTNMSSMFLGCDAFNQDISGWDTSNVINMDGTFRNTKNFNQPIGVWNTSKVTSMRTLFNRADAFNQPIGDWDTSSVIDMSWMFQVSPLFNQDISRWNTSNVVDMKRMFSDTTVFNQDLSKWCVSKIENKPDFFDSSAPAWTLPKPVWGTCPSRDDVDEPVTPPVELVNGVSVKPLDIMQKKLVEPLHVRAKPLDILQKKVRADMIVSAKPLDITTKSGV